MQRLGTWFRRGALATVLCGFVSQGAIADDGVAGDLGELRTAAKGPAGLSSLDEFATLSGASFLRQEEAAENPLLQGWSFGGFIQTAYTYNFNRPNSVSAKPSAPLDTDGDGQFDTIVPGSAENSGRVFDTEHNEFTINNATLRVSKEATEGSWVGLNFLVMAGHDAKFIHATGLNDDEDFDLVDANFVIAIPDEVGIFGGGELKIGKWQTIVGAETISGDENVNYSRSYAFGYAIPFVHVGALYSQDVLTNADGDMVAGIDLAFVNSTAGEFEDSNDSKGYLGRVRVAPCPYLNFHIAGVVGNEPTLNSNESDTRAILDIVANVSMPDTMPEALQKLSFILNYDFGGQESGDPTTGRGTAKWYAFSGIAKYTINPKWYVAVRGEAFRDSEGAAIGLTDTTGAFARDYMEITATLGYIPWDNFQVRAEWRYDKADKDVFSDSMKSAGADDYMNTLAVDAIVTF